MLHHTTSKFLPGLTALLLSAALGCSGGGPSVNNDGGDPDGGADSGLDGSGGDGGDGGGGGDGGTDGSGGGDGSATDGGTPDGNAFPTNDAGETVFPTNDAGQVLCGSVACTCSDGMDNDGDGLVDGFDPECTGPYDDDESSFATGISGDNKDDYQDCFFDGNSGNSAGDCRIASVCLLDRDSQECLDSFKGQRTLEEEEMACKDYCAPRAPNGCDCLGCCEVFTSDTESTFVIIDSACQVELDAAGHGMVGDGCTICEPSTICVNECGECELCLGRTVDDLPDTCFPSSNPDGGTADAGSPDAGTSEPVPQCVDGAGNERPNCSVDMPCGAGQYCFNGCCFPTLI